MTVIAFLAGSLDFSRVLFKFHKVSIFPKTVANTFARFLVMPDNFCMTVQVKTLFLLISLAKQPRPRSEVSHSGPDWARL